MNCPKCDKPIFSYDFYCSNCGKILKIECPCCGTINTGFVCSKCKLQLVTKCKICGTKNHVTVTRCRKCKGRLVTNPKIQNANIHKFATVCIEFKNLEAIRLSMGSDYEEFVQKLHKYIQFKTLKDVANYKFINYQLISVNFSRSDTISESCSAAVEFAKQIFDFISDVNNNLENMSYEKLKIKIALSIVNLFDRRTLARTERSISTNNDIDITAHPTIYKYTGDNYKFEHLVTIDVNGNYTPFYGLAFEPEEHSQEHALPGSRAGEEDEEAKKEENLPFIKFAGKKNQLLKVPQSKLFNTLEEIITRSSDGAFINVKDEINTGKMFLINENALTGNLQNFISVRTSCTKNSKYYPFNLFRTIIRNFFGLNECITGSTEEKILIKNKLFSILNFHAEELANVLFLEADNDIHNIPELRDKLFLQVYNLLFALSSQNKLVIMVDDFENIDKGSADCLNYLIQRNILKEKVYFIVSTASDFKLSKTLSGIYKYENYYKILLQPDDSQEIYRYLNNRIKNVRKNTFIEKIVKNSQNSLFYTDQVIYYLFENNILKYESDGFKIVSDSIIPMPLTVEKIVERRVFALIHNKELLKSFLTLVFLGEKVSIHIFKACMNDEHYENKLKKLGCLGFVKCSEEGFITVKNYNLIRKFILDSVDKENLAQVTENIYTGLSFNDSILHPLNIEYLEYLNKPKEALKVLNNYSQICSGVGDISAFICCIEKFIAEIDKNTQDVGVDKLEYINKMKLDCYEQVGELAYEIYPEITFNFMEKAISLAEDLNEEDRIIKLCGVNAYCCNYIGNYSKALYYTGKIFSGIPRENLDINSSEFNIKLYILNFIKIQALFNTGQLKKCIEKSEEVLKTLEKVKENSLYDEVVSATLIDKIITDIRLFIIKSELIRLNGRSAELTEKFSSFGTNNFAFEILSLGKDIINGAKEDFYDRIPVRDLDPESSLLYAISAIIYNLQCGDTTEAANVAYSYKQTALSLKDYQVMYFFDLIIGLAYKNIGNLPKAKMIYEDVLRISTKKNLLHLFFMSWYLIADMELYKGNAENALEIVNNVNIKLEQDHNLSKIFSIYFKHLLSRIFEAKGNSEYAIKFEEQAIKSAVKHGLNYNAICYYKNLYEIIHNLLKNEEDDEKVEKLEEKIKNLLNEVNLLEQKMA